eukprot:scaffold1595_cov276-Chaetoceros_neogracile.AAC.3
MMKMCDVPQNNKIINSFNPQGSQVSKYAAALQILCAPPPATDIHLGRMKNYQHIDLRQRMKSKKKGKSALVHGKHNHDIADSSDETTASRDKKKNMKNKQIRCNPPLQIVLGICVCAFFLLLVSVTTTKYDDDQLILQQNVKTTFVSPLSVAAAALAKNNDIMMYGKNDIASRSSIRRRHSSAGAQTKDDANIIPDSANPSVELQLANNSDSLEEHTRHVSDPALTFEISHFLKVLNRSTRDLPRAPWDPILAGRGQAAIQNSCHSEIQKLGCSHSLPLSACMEKKMNDMDDTNVQALMLGKSCNKFLNPCKFEEVEQCEQTKAFATVMTVAERRQVESLLGAIEIASMMESSNDETGEGSLQYWMTAGSMIGSLAHHAIIPWDDDIDVYVRAEHMASLLENLESLGFGISWTKGEGYEKRVYKLYNASLPKIKRRYEHTYPFIDLFPVNCTDGISCIETNNQVKPSTPIMWIFPLKRRPFGRMSMPFPAKVEKVVMTRYGSRYKKICHKDAYDHRIEHWYGAKHVRIMNCSDVFLPSAFVSDWYDIDQIDDGTVRSHHPWPVDFPHLFVEHIISDTDIRLSSVLFNEGNEIRRSYADGLLDVEGNVITYSLPQLSGHVEELVPFLQEERDSFLLNAANRSAKALNREVLPILNRALISNLFLNSSLKQRGAHPPKLRLRICEWNAERGVDWDVLTSFYSNPDIIILNEMDWGMARSGNIDTTKQMSQHLKMNYAYGVEFLELTNGNEREINATFGKHNHIGYHGNAVLSKWPILESKIVRLHSLFDLLYEEKTSGQAKGERRLGGRMALFTSIETFVGKILIISMHTHSGSSRNLLRGDAALVCDEIQRWNITNVIIGGDIATPIPKWLVSDCDFFALGKTNSRQEHGKGLTPTWKVGKINISSLSVSS